jgi:hypothetical protein
MTQAEQDDRMLLLNFLEGGRYVVESDGSFREARVDELGLFEVRDEKQTKHGWLTAGAASPA